MNNDKSFLQYAIEALTVNYANFQGRARRKEFVATYVLTWSAGLALVILIGLLARVLGDTLASILLSIGMLGLSVPTVSVTARRLHDTGRPAWWAVAIFIPFGYILIFYFASQQGQPHDNEYGVDPKA